MINLFDLYFYEDCSYQDESAELLRLKGRGKMRIISREKGTCTCAGDLAEYYERKGLKILSCLKDGETFNPGDTIIEAEGDLKLLFRLWRVSQTFLTLMCAIATKTASFVSEGRKANPDLIIATSRKTHPGSRIFELKAVRAGGGDIHRTPSATPSRSARTTWMPSENWESSGAMKKIEIEPRTREEAFKYVGMADIMLLDHLSPRNCGNSDPN